MDTPFQLSDHITPEKSYVLTFHRRPDGDSIGSNLAMARYLQSVGASVQIFSIDPVPEYLEFMTKPNTTPPITVISPFDIPWKSFDTYIALDMASREMIGAEIPLPPIDILVIDHHRSNSGWGTVNVIRPDEISCASILYDLFTDSGIPLSQGMAQDLLTGLATDSGFFSFNRTGKAFRTAAELMNVSGVDYQQIVFEVKRHMRPEDLEFIGKALSNVSVDYQNRIVFVELPYSLIGNNDEYGDQNHLITGYIQSISGTDFGVIITEEEPGIFRCNFRARNPDTDVSAIAVQLGGGGHKAAAGATTNAKHIEDVRNTIISLHS